MVHLIVNFDENLRLQDGIFDLRLKCVFIKSYRRLNVD